MDTGGYRNLLREEADAELESTGTVRQSIRLAARSMEGEYDLSPVLESAPEELGAVVLRRFAEHPDMARLFRVGEVSVTTPAGHIQAIGILEHMREGWWLTYRLLAHDTEWREAAGVIAEELDEPFRPWLQVGHQGELSEILVRTLDFVGPARGRVRVEALPAPPTNARAAARMAEVMVRADLLAGLFEHVTVIVFRNRTVERWEIVTSPGCSLDDLVRNVAQLAPVVAVALVRNAEGLGPGGEVRKALGVTAECGSVQWADAWHFVPVEDKVEMVLVDEQELGDPGPQSWFDVPPAVKLGIPLPLARGRWVPFGPP